MGIDGAQNNALQNYIAKRAESECRRCLLKDDEMTETQDSFTLFVQAALSGDTDSLQRMLDDGFDVNQSNTEGETAFSWCCAENVLVSAKFLHANGADVNVRLAGVSTPLDIAVCWASPEFRGWLRSVGGTRLNNFEEWPWPAPQKKRKPLT